MKIRAYPKDEHLEAELFLKLIERDGGGVTLSVVKSDGCEVSGGNIATIRSDGSLWLHSSIDPNLGLQLDSGGHIEYYEFM